MQKRSTLIHSIAAEYRRHKALAESAIAQLSDEELALRQSPGSNSVAVIMKHLAGNLSSRFTDFLTTDGEKPWRHRDSEFEGEVETSAELVANWADGWRILFETLAKLSDADLERTVSIRGMGLSVSEALHRSLAHTAYHVGQIVYVAKATRGSEWEHLSIPPGQSESYNSNPNRERPPRPNRE